MVQVVGRAWIWLWASDLENQGIQSESQPAFLCLLWLSPIDYKWILFLKVSPDFLKTCSSLLKFTKGIFQMKAALFSAPSFWSVLFVSVPIPLDGLMPLLLSTCHAHHYTFQPDSPDELQSDFPLAICQKHMPTGLLASLAQVELQESKEGMEVNILGSISFQSIDLHIFQGIFLLHLPY